MPITFDRKGEIAWREFLEHFWPSSVHSESRYISSKDSPERVTLRKSGKCVKSENSPLDPIDHEKYSSPVRTSHREIRRPPEVHCCQPSHPRASTSGRQIKHRRVADVSKRSQIFVLERIKEQVIIVPDVVLLQDVVFRLREFAEFLAEIDTLLTCHLRGRR